MNNFVLKHDNNLFLLTEKETQVLSLLGKGMDYNDISKQLYVTKNTTLSHVANIFYKLEVHNRTEAVLYFLNNKINRLEEEIKRLKDVKD